MRVCSSSDLPEPVVPATRAWGPSARTSRENRPSASSPMTARVLARPPCQRESTAAASGSGMPMTSSSREERGIAPASPWAETSRSGARARATRCAQPAGTRSRLTCSISSLSVCDTPAQGSSAATTARHSSGRDTRSSSRHSSLMPAAGPSRRTRTMPGTRRRARAPSSTTRVNGPAPAPPAAPAASWRRSIRDTRAPTWRAIVSSSMAARTRAPVPSGARAWGSQQVHAHSSPARAPRPGSTSTMRSSSAGEWSTAHWASIHRATSRRFSPATPATPSRPSGTDTGTSDADQANGSSQPARSGSLSSTSLGRSAVPTRRSSQSGSWMRLSHSPALGPVARSMTSAASGWSSRRARRSSTSALKAALSASRFCSRKRATASRCIFLAPERVARRLPIIMSGDSSMNSSDMTRCVMKKVAPPMTSGASSMIGENGCLRGAVGSCGTVNTADRAGRASRGGRLKSRVGAPRLAVTTASAAGTGPIMSWVRPRLRTASRVQAAGSDSARRSSSTSLRGASGSSSS